MRRRPWLRLSLVAALAIPGAMAPRLGWTQAQPPQTSSKTDPRAVTGEWRSRELFENQPRATVTVQDEGGALNGSLTLLGMTRGADDRATLRVTFRAGSWDGATLLFDTELPDNEGKARWALRLIPPGKVTLAPVSPEGRPIEDGPFWEMTRR